MTAGVVTFACPADGCGLAGVEARVAARVLVPAVAQLVLRQLRTAAAPS